MEGPLIGIIITLIFSAFFSGMEIAYISSNRLKIELDKSKGTIKGKTREKQGKSKEKAREKQGKSKGKARVPD